MHTVCCGSNFVISVFFFFGSGNNKKEEQEEESQRTLLLLLQCLLFARIVTGVMRRKDKDRDDKREKEVLLLKTLPEFLSTNRFAHQIHIPHLLQKRGKSDLMFCSFLPAILFFLLQKMGKMSMRRTIS